MGYYLIPILSITAIVLLKLYLSTAIRLYGHISRPRTLKNKDALRIGTLGAAAITPPALIAPASKMKDIEVTAVAARDINLAKKYAAKYKIKTVHQNYQELIDDPNIDAIYNPLPNSLHCEWTIKALRAGKHVLCEKPIASNEREARLMKQAADESGKLLVEAFHYRFHPAAKRVKDVINSGHLGTIEKVDVKFHVPGNLLFKSSDIRFNFALGGGSMTDLGGYAVNFVRFAVGDEPAEIISAKATLFRPEIDGRMEASMVFPSGCVGSIDVALKSWTNKAVIRVVGSRGTLVIKGFPLFSLYNSIEVTTSSGQTWKERIYGTGQSTYYYQLETFVKLARGEKVEYTTTAEDGVRNMKVIDDIYRKAGLQVRGTQ